MWSYESIVSMSFRWIDFAIIISLGAYVFWRWGLPFFKQEKQVEAKKWQDLESNITRYMSNAHLLETTLMHDQQRIKDLEQNILLWNAAYQKQQIKHAQQQEVINARLIEQQEHKKATIQKIALYQKAVPQALHEAEVALKAQFAKESYSRQFLDTIVAKFKKGAV